MAFDRQNAERELNNILNRARTVNSLIESDVINYRRQDTLVDEEDQYRTMRDIRAYLLRAYREMDQILTSLDKYK